jgi:hypothetical protein
MMPAVARWNTVFGPALHSGKTLDNDSKILNGCEKPPWLILFLMRRHCGDKQNHLELCGGSGPVCYLSRLFSSGNSTYVDIDPRQYKGALARFRSLLMCNTKKVLDLRDKVEKMMEFYCYNVWEPKADHPFPSIRKGDDTNEDVSTPLRLLDPAAVEMPTKTTEIVAAAKSGTSTTETPKPLDDIPMEDRDTQLPDEEEPQAEATQLTQPKSPATSEKAKPPNQKKKS